MVFQVYRHAQRNASLRASRRSNNTSGRISRIAELLLQVVIVGLAAAVIGTAGHVYSSYKHQVSENNPVWLPLWQGHFDTTSTIVLIGTGSAILFLGLVALILSFVPKINHRNQPKLSALVLIATSVLSILLAISSLAVTQMLEHHRSQQDTLRSWTCRFGDAGASWSIPKFMSNGDFDELCTESRFAYYAMIPILVLETFIAILGVARFFASKRAVGTPVLADKSSDY